MKQGQFNIYFLIRNSRLASSRSGQALIEYVLILFVSISLIMGARTLLVGVRNILDGYMGSYVRCLMDHGELPSRGLQSSDLNKSTSGSYNCDTQFSFKIQNGFQPNGSGGSFGDGTGGASGSKSGSKSSNDSSNSKSANNSSEGSDSTGTTSGSSLSDVASRERNRRSRGSSADSSASSGDSNSSLLKSSRARSSDGEDDTSASSSRVIGDAAPKGQTADADGDSARSGRARYRALTGEMSEKIEKNSKRAQTNSRSKPGVPTVIAEEEGGTLGPRKSAVTPWERKPTAVEEEVESAFSVGKIFKYIIIIALIIMIVIFFGGQLLNYSKSDD